ncbi:uncharacterized protein LOC144427258 [Styela clava]
MDLEKFMFLILVGSFIFPISESQHPCLSRATHLVHRRKCYTMIDLKPSTRLEVVQACEAEDSSILNIRDVMDFDVIIDHVRNAHSSLVNADEAFMHIGNTINPNTLQVKNFDGSDVSFPARVWSSGEPTGTAGGGSTNTIIILGVLSDPSSLSNGMVTFRPTASFARMVFCETRELSCTTPPIDGNSQEIACAEDEDPLSCTISCKEGFSLADGSKSIVLTCQENLLWDREIMDTNCISKECPKLSFEGQSGFMSCSGTKIYDKCSFFCDSQKKIKGSRTRTCGQDSKWTGMQPTCDDVVCDAIIFSAEQGTMDCTDGNNYASHCSFYCKTGLQRWGAKKVICLWTGEWSDEPPTCKKYDPKCPATHKHTSCPDTNCAVNADCNDDKKICCPTKCGTSVCYELPKRVIPKGALLLFLLSGLGRNQCPTNCLRNACETARCPANLNAQCRTSCNGCRAHFYDFNQEITRKCRFFYRRISAVV